MSQHLPRSREAENVSFLITRPSTAKLALIYLLAIAAQTHAQSVEGRLRLRELECKTPRELKTMRANAVGGLRWRPPVDFTLTYECEFSSTPDLSHSSRHASAIDAGGSANSTLHTGSFLALPRCRRSAFVETQQSECSNNRDGDPVPASDVSLRNHGSEGIERNSYYRNRLEFSLDGGWLPINIPFVFDVFLGDAYTMTSLRYTLVPIIGSVRWQINDIGGPGIFRGNWDLQCGAAITVIPRGPETRYSAWMLGVRRNFVPRHGQLTPYFDGRVGMGHIDAKGPAGVLYAQGQDFTFTVNLGAGLRYNLNPRYSISAGLNWMHISNLYLSEPQFSNYGINVYGPMAGINVRLRKPRRDGSD